MIHNNFDPKFDEIDELLHHRFNVKEGEFDFTEPHILISKLSSYIQDSNSEYIKTEVLSHIYLITSRDEVELRTIENTLQNWNNDDPEKEYQKGGLEFAKTVLFRKINVLIEWMNSNTEAKLPLVSSNISNIQPQSQTIKSKKKYPISTVWLNEPKISIEKLMKIGVQNKLWDENRNLLTTRDSLYSSNKSMLASLSIALKGNSIGSEINYNMVGESFCKTFNIEINPQTKDPYKSFSTGNPRVIKEFKRLFLLV